MAAACPGDKKPIPRPCAVSVVKKVHSRNHAIIELVAKYLHTTPEKMVRFGQMTTSGGALNGTLGINAHYANALASPLPPRLELAACVLSLRLV
ncbi:hypothetical protein O9992_26720 [Vibrio lentus]|nr:hypothetical protein [Vibrio lentus]